MMRDQELSLLRNNDHKHTFATYRTAAEVSLRFPKVQVVNEGRSWRLYLGDQKVQVFARFVGDWQVSDWRRPFYEDTTTVIYVDYHGDEPQFFIMPAAWMTAKIKNVYEEWLAKHGGVRPNNPRSTHYSIYMSSVEQWRDRWDVLESELEVAV